MSTTDTNGATPSATPRSGIETAAEAFEAVLSGSDQETEDEEEKAPQDDEPSDDQEEGTEKPESEDEEGEESEESESEEDDDESEDEEESETEEEADPVYAVTVDGQEVEVPLSELVKGYSRTADYTRKTQALAEERKTFQGEVQQTRVLRDQYAQGLQQLEAALQAQQPQEPDWEALRASDPIEFAAEWADHQRRQVLMQRMAAERQALVEQQQRESESERKEAVAKARDWLMERIPEWKDPEKAKADRAAIKAFGLKQGFTAEEIGEIDDPRAILILRMAMRHARAQEKTAAIKPVKKTSPVLKPGPAKSAPTTSKTSDLTRAKQRLAKTGKVSDAAEVFKKFL
jgi:hypothetical protein